MSATDLVLRLIGVLEELGIAYMLVGSYSSNFYGRPRSTNDADFVVAMEAEQLGRVGAALGPEFRVERQLGFETITMHARHLIVHPGTLFQIELFQLADDAFNRSRFSRRRQVTFEGHSTWLPSPEDVIVQKLLWAASGTNRQQDLIDAAEVLGVQKDLGLDLEYIRYWTAQHGTLEMFERLLKT